MTSMRKEFGIGPIDQVGYVVADIDRVLPFYEGLYGPFTVAEYPMDGVSYGDRTVDCRLRIAFNRSGPVEIELIQSVEGDTPYLDHLRRYGDGLHHVRFRVDSLDAKLPALLQAGFSVVFGKRFSPAMAFAYLSVPREFGTGLIELFQSAD